MRLTRAAGLVLAASSLVAVGCGSGDSDTPAAASGDEPAIGAADVDAAPPMDDAETTTTTTAPPRSFTLAASGDILVHSPVYERALRTGGGDRYDFRPMFAQVQDRISGADWAICHMETPVSATNERVSGYPIFNAPREIAADLAAVGYDACDTASNHTLDQGERGVTATLDVFDAAGLRHAGSARTAEEAAAVTLVDVEGVAVAHLAYTYGTNGIPVPAGKPWMVDLIDPEVMLADAARARQAGAEFVVMSVHWGNEYQARPTEEQQALARTLLASPDVDLILGCHVHVVQPIEKIGDEYVVYGMGNFLSNQSPAAGLLPQTQDGILVELTVTETPDGFVVSEAGYTPTFVTRPDYVIVPAGPTTQRDSFVRTVQAVEMLGPEANDVEPTTGSEADAGVVASSSSTTRAPVGTTGTVTSR